MLDYFSRLSRPVISLGLVALLSGCAASSPYYGDGPAEIDSTAGDYLKARFAARQQELDYAADAFDSAHAAVPQDISILRKTFFYELAAGNVADSVRFAEKLLQPEYSEQRAPANPNEPQPVLALPQLTVAADRIRAGDYAQAREILSGDVDSRFSRSLAFLMEAWAAYEDDGLAAGLAVLDKDRSDLFTGFTPLHRALMLDLEGQVEEAGAEYQQAIANLGNDTAITAYADFLERTGRRNAENRREAIKVYQNLAGNAGTLRRTGRLGLARYGQPVEGETAGSLRLARVKPDRLVANGKDGAALALQNFAWASYEQIMSEQAAAVRAGFSQTNAALNTPLAFAQLATYLNDDLDAAHYVIGAIFVSYELPDNAIAEYQQIDFQNSFYEYAQMDIAEAWLALEQPERAISALQEFIAKDALTPDARLQLANLLADEERFEEADAVLTEAIGLADQLMSDEAKEANLWRYYFSRGAMRIDAGWWDEGEADLRAAAELSPNQPYVLNFLGYSWAERGRNLDEAFEMLETALSMQPHSGAIVDSVGWAHYQLGNYDEAVGYLERAVALEPSDPVITDHLGDAYWQTDRPIEAKYEWRRALTFEPDDELRVRIEAKLAGGAVAPGAAADAGGAD